MAIASDVDTGFSSATSVGVDARTTRVSWAAVSAGVVMVLAVQLLLSMLGLGIGLSTVDPIQSGGAPNASTFGIGAGIWWSLSYLVALVVGGYVSARLASNVLEFDGVLHGLLTWALALLIAVVLLSTALSR